MIWRLMDDSPNNAGISFLFTHLYFNTAPQLYSINQINRELIGKIQRQCQRKNHFHPSLGIGKKLNGFL
jgi:hypothetical protein